MTDRGTLRARWIDEVFRTPQVSAEVKVLLLSLAHYDMDDSGRVSVPRTTLAERNRCHPRKITEKLKAAIDGGLLRQVARGQKHQTAVYAALIPGVSQGADSRPPETSQGAEYRPAEPDSQGAKKRHPENAQGAGSRPAEASQGADSRPPNMYGGSDVGDGVEEVNSDGLFVDGSAASRRAAPKTSTTKRPRRKPERPIPDIFAVTDDKRAWAADHPRGITVDLDSQTERFINHARQNDRLCRDWDAAWRNWILKAQDFADSDRRRYATGTDGVPGHGPRAQVNNQWTNGQEIEL